MPNKEKRIKKPNEIDIITESAHREFSDAADYIWKTPRFIDKEFADELQKLPNDPEIASIRWHFESKKLKHVFPFLLATGNLFSVTSLFETYLLRLAKEVEKITSNTLSSVKGQGVQRLFNFFKACGIKPDSISLWPQIDAAIKIRNCLTHASGLLEWSRDNKELRRIVNSGTFLSKDNREKYKKVIGDLDQVTIYVSGFGDRIQISNNYSWISYAYYRDFFIELCEKSKEHD
jgi:hypothetical protein